MGVGNDRVCADSTGSKGLQKWYYVRGAQEWEILQMESGQDAVDIKLEWLGNSVHS